MQPYPDIPENVISLELWQWKLILRNLSFLYILIGIFNNFFPFFY